MVAQLCVVSSMQANARTINPYLSQVRKFHLCQKNEKKNPLKNNDDFKERFKTTLIADHFRRDIESYKK